MPPTSDGAPQRMPPRAGVADALGWLLLGGAVVAASLAMDRLESQDVPPFAAPGLLPGLLGVGLLLLGAVMLARSLRRSGAVVTDVTPEQPRGRAALVIGLCVLFGAGLVGHGLPFWLAAAAFVAVAIVLLQPATPGERRFGARRVLLAAVIGLGAGGAVTLVFQRIFLVRLP